MTIKEFNYLPEDARTIRSEVFVKEQGFTDEFDDIDDIAVHIVLYDKENPIATCRIYFQIERQTYVIGRIAVIKEYRGKNIGAGMLRFAEESIRHKGKESVILSAQVRVAEFYEKQGYQKQGLMYLDEDCPHIWMKKDFDDKEE
nr:GNAT family N-acetyltransferase [uncultured Clostridium sp.]